MTQTPELLTYLTDAAEPGPALRPLRVGDAVELRLRPGGTEIEAWLPRGPRLGRLPPAERQALAPLIGAGPCSLRARIAALVPRPPHAGGARIHIRVVAG